MRESICMYKCEYAEVRVSVYVLMLWHVSVTTCFRQLLHL